MGGNGSRTGAAREGPRASRRGRRLVADLVAVTDALAVGVADRRADHGLTGDRGRVGRSLIVAGVVRRGRSGVVHGLARLLGRVPVAALRVLALGVEIALLVLLPGRHLGGTAAGPGRGGARGRLDRRRVAALLLALQADLPADRPSSQRL